MGKKAEFVDVPTRTVAMWVVMSPDCEVVQRFPYSGKQDAVALAQLLTESTPVKPQPKGMK